MTRSRNRRYTYEDAGKRERGSGGKLFAYGMTEYCAPNRRRVSVMRSSVQTDL